MFCNPLGYSNTSKPFHTSGIFPVTFSQMTWIWKWWYQQNPKNTAMNFIPIVAVDKQLHNYKHLFSLYQQSQTFKISKAFLKKWSVVVWNVCTLQWNTWFLYLEEKSTKVEAKLRSFRMLIFVRYIITWFVCINTKLVSEKGLSTRGK